MMLALKGPLSISQHVDGITVTSIRERKTSDGTIGSHSEIDMGPSLFFLDNTLITMT